MKILIISGFLGAGKTSFIKEMANKTGRQFVVLENEFGDLGLDGQLLQQSADNEKFKVWELTDGCICCSLNLNLNHSILTIANALDPDYLLIEPSGVALPSRILKQLNSITYEKITLSAPITIIDANQYEMSRQKYPAHFQDQLSVAGTVVISKSEQLSPYNFEQIKTALNLPNDVFCPSIHYNQWTKEQWLDLLDKGITLKETEKSGQIKRIFLPAQRKAEAVFDNISLNRHNLVNVEELERCLQLLLSPLLGDIARAKGYCRLGKFWVKFDLVGTEYAITGCDEMPDERIVVIGSKLNKKQIVKLFNP